MSEQLQEELKLKLTGLFTNPNVLSSVPDGSLAQADNCVLERPGIISTRRGQQFYGTALSSPPTKIFNFNNQLLINYDDKMAYDSDGMGTWVDYSGTYLPPNSYSKIRSLEANKNFYFTTSKGIYKLDDLLDTPIPAGSPAALGGTGITTGTTGFMQPNTNVAYRLVWGYTDDNNNLILGAPSNRVIVGNQVITTTGTITIATNTITGMASTTGMMSGMLVTDLAGGIPVGTTIISVDSSSQITISQDASETLTGDTIQVGFPANVSLKFNIPNQITATHSWFYQLYRSAQSINLSTEPDDNLQQVYQAFVTSTDLTNGYISITDITPDDQRQTLIYTAPNAGNGGIAASNYQPPLAADMCYFEANNTTYYANTISKNRLTINLNGSGTDSLNYVSTTGNLVILTYTITSIPSTANLHVGMRVVGTGIPSNSVIVSIDSSSQITMSYAATANGTGTSLEFQDGIFVYDASNTLRGSYWGGSTQSTANSQFQIVTALDAYDNITQTSYNLVNLICELNSYVVAYYQSTFTSNPGLILFEGIQLGDLGFYLTSTMGTAFTPILPSSGNTISSANDANVAAVYFSTAAQPESVPLANTLVIGDPNKKILRIFALRFSVMVLKEDGIYRIPNGGSPYLFDSSVKINAAAESGVKFQNSVYAWSDQGIVSINESGVRIVSPPVENTLLQVSSEQYTNFSSVSFGVAYEKSKSYIFFTVSNITDTYPTQAFIYNWYTDSFTRWPIARTCGLVNSADEKLYVASPLNNYVYQERKNYDLTDYSDEQFPVTIVSSSGTTITLTDTTNCAIGQSIVQGIVSDIITNVVDSTHVTVVNTNLWTAGSATVYNPIINYVEWNPITAGNAGMGKYWNDMIFYFQDAAFTQITCEASTNFVASNAIITLQATSFQTSWDNFAWDSVIWGGNLGGPVQIRTIVPTRAARGLYMNLALSNTQCFNSFNLTGVSLSYINTSRRFR